MVASYGIAQLENFILLQLSQQMETVYIWVQVMNQETVITFMQLRFLMELFRKMEQEQQGRGILQKDILLQKD